jgi:hypothetical protein
MRIHIAYAALSCVVCFFAGAQLATNQRPAEMPMQTSAATTAAYTTDYDSVDYYTVYRCTNPVWLGRGIIVCDEDMSVQTLAWRIQASRPDNRLYGNQSVLFQHDGFASDYQPR